MTAAAPGERDLELYTGPPPTLRPSPDLRAQVAQPEEEPPEAAPPPARPTPYLLAMRAAPWAWWRPLAGLAVIAVLLGVALVLTRILDLLTGTGAALDPVPLAWDRLLVTDLLLAVALPGVLLAWPIAHGVGPGPASSAEGRFRWPLLRRFARVALGTAGLGLVLACAGAVLLAGRDVPGPVAGFPWVLVVGLLTLPLRAAAEEFLFRGYLSQAIAGWLGRPRLGAVAAAVASALLWAALPGVDDPAGFAGRVAFGLAASAAVALTGGLEAAVALHLVCALVALVLGAGLGEDAVPGLAPGGPGAAFAVIGLAGVVAFVAVLAGRRARS